MPGFEINFFDNEVYIDIREEYIKVASADCATGIIHIRIKREINLNYLRGSLYSFQTPIAILKKDVLPELDAFNMLVFISASPYITRVMV